MRTIAYVVLLRMWSRSYWSSTIFCLVFGPVAISVSTGETILSCDAPVLCTNSQDAPRRMRTEVGILGSSGFSGDSGPPTRARLQSPSSVSVNPAIRKLVVADEANHAVRLADLGSGVLSTVAGIIGSPGRPGHGLSKSLSQLRSPQGVVLVGNTTYIADAGNHIVRSLDIDTGLMVVVAGVYGNAGRTGDGGPAAIALLNFPTSVVLDATSQLLYIADSHNHAVRVVSANPEVSNVLTTVVGVLGSGGLSGNGGVGDQSLLHFPRALCLDTKGKQLFIAEPFNHAVRAWSIETGKLSTIAGTLGIAGDSGDGNLATSARLNYPTGIDLDVSARQLYVADSRNHVIRMVDLATRRIWLVAGVYGSFGRAVDGGQATLGQLYHPTDVAVDHHGRKMYIADQSNHAVRSVDLAARVILTIAGELGEDGFANGEQGSGLVRLHSPRSVYVHEQSKSLFIADASNRAVRRVSIPNGVVSTAVGPAGTSPETVIDFEFPCGVAMEQKVSNPKLYVADAAAHVVYSVDISAGAPVVLAGRKGMFDLSVDSSFLNRPCDLALDSHGQKLYIADSGNHAVRGVDFKTSQVFIVAGTLGVAGIDGDGGAATNGHLHGPSGVAFDDSGGGTVYIADTQNHAIRAVDLILGKLTTVAGVLGNGGYEGNGGPSTIAQLHFPYSVAVDTLRGHLYIADNWNHAIRHVNLETGLLTTISGVLGFHGLAGDRGRADEALLYFPIGLFMDAESKSLYFADSGNHAVRRVALSDEARQNFSEFGLA